MINHRRIFPESPVHDGLTYLVIGVPKDDEGDNRVALKGSYDDCAAYADRNESPDNYERYYVAEVTA